MHCRLTWTTPNALRQIQNLAVSHHWLAVREGYLSKAFRYRIAPYVIIPFCVSPDVPPRSSIILCMAFSVGGRPVVRTLKSLQYLHPAIDYFADVEENVAYVLGRSLARAWRESGKRKLN